MKVIEKLWLLGSNRRCDKTIVEQLVSFSETEQVALQQAGDNLAVVLPLTLSELGIEDPLGLLKFEWQKACPELSFCQLFARLVIVLQVAAGHRVQQLGAVVDDADQGYWVWFEYEHDAVAAAAAALAFYLLGSLEPELQLPDLAEESKELQDVSWEGFLKLASPRVLTLEAAALLEAAQSLDVPCVKLERLPYGGHDGAFRIRHNGLLKLGHGPYQQIVDGSMCVSRHASLLTLLNDRKARRTLLAGQGLPLPVSDPQAGNCALRKHALRAAERIGYPVVLSVTTSNGQTYSWPDIPHPQALRSSLDQARKHGTRINLEQSLAGEYCQLLMVGTTVHALLINGQIKPVASLNVLTQQQLESFVTHLGSGVLGIHLRAVDLSQPLGQGNGAVLDFELAPKLDHWLENVPDLLATVSKAFVRYLFPPGSPSTIPIVAVTGTNGKTTTCRMLEAILRHSGLGTGMICTETNYVNGQLQKVEKEAWHGRQFRMFDKPEVDVAVLEEFLGTVVGTGFIYRQSDVAICTNVTEDHLGRIGIHDFDTLVATKALVTERARDAVVLNADNEPSLGMMQSTEARKVGLISLHQPAEKVLDLLDRPGLVCVREDHQGQAWLIIYQAGNRIPVMPENEIPATYQGKAAHNTANAMQAILAAHFLGVDWQVIRSAMAGFQPNFTNSEGRLNMMDGLPFQLLLDYAHNLDGYRVLCDFTDQLDVPGRRILLLSYSGDRLNRAMQQVASFLAPHFDRYICTNDSGSLRGRGPDEVPLLLVNYLSEAGISPEKIEIEPNRKKAIQAALHATQAGDLLVMTPDSEENKSIWQQLQALKVTELNPSSEA